MAVPALKILRKVLETYCVHPTAADQRLELSMPRKATQNFVQLCCWRIPAPWNGGQTRRALRYWELRPEPDKRPEETMGYNGTMLRIECSIREWRTSKLQTLTVFNLIWESVGNFAIWPHHAYMMPIRLYWLYSSQSSGVIHPNGTTLTPSFTPKLGSQHRRGASSNI